jgi:hypothetical protein
MPTNTIKLTTEAENADLPGSESDFGGFLGGIMSALMVIAAVFVLLQLIWGAIDWISSGGDKSKVEAARNKIMNAVIGLIVLASATALFMLIQQFLDICVLSFSGSC